MKKDRLYDILETMKKNPLQAVLSHFGALSDHSAWGPMKEGVKGCEERGVIFSPCVLFCLNSVRNA